MNLAGEKTKKACEQARINNSLSSVWDLMKHLKAGGNKHQPSKYAYKSCGNGYTSYGRNISDLCLYTTVEYSDSCCWSKDCRCEEFTSLLILLSNSWKKEDASVSLLICMPYWSRCIVLTEDVQNIASSYKHSSLVGCKLPHYFLALRPKSHRNILRKSWVPKGPTQI